MGRYGKRFGVDNNGNIPCTFSFSKPMRALCGQPFTVSSIMPFDDRLEYRRE